MAHPCASASPPSWCNKKRKRKRRSTHGLSAVTPAQIAAHLKKHKVRKATEAECKFKSGKKKGKLKPGCFWGRAALKGTLLKKTR
jgi:ribosomal protein L32